LEYYQLLKRLAIQIGKVPECLKRFCVLMMWECQGFEMGLKELITTACWYMWWGRRRISHDEPVQIPSRSPQAIFALALNFSRSCKRNSGIRRHGWEKPPKGFVKLNIDAAFSIDSLSGATGAVIHDK
jgi:hypothetical protein